MSARFKVQNIPVYDPSNLSRRVHDTRPPRFKGATGDCHLAPTISLSMSISNPGRLVPGLFHQRPVEILDFRSSTNLTFFHAQGRTELMILGWVLKGWRHSPHKNQSAAYKLSVSRAFTCVHSTGVVSVPYSPMTAVDLPRLACTTYNFLEIRGPIFRCWV